MPSGFVKLDGSYGEGGGQILRTALALALITGRAFQLQNVRARRDKPGLRPQHVSAVGAAAQLCDAQVQGASVGSPTLTFHPGTLLANDLAYDIGTAGATSLVLQTVNIPIALATQRPVTVSLIGGTYNDRAPSFPFLQETWRRYLSAAGFEVDLSIPRAGFYPRGGGQLEAVIEPARPRALALTERGPLLKITGYAQLCNVNRVDIAERMIGQARQRLNSVKLDAEFEFQKLAGVGQGVSFFLTAEFEPAGTQPAVHSTYVVLGALGKRAEVVADEAVNELLTDLQSSGALDRHSADQLLLPLALAPAPSHYSVALVTDHLRTNIHTIGRFLERTITLDCADSGSAIVMLN
jgi:RNA 3'-terminal phosphate cyclase (ATP)